MLAHTSPLEHLLLVIVGAASVAVYGSAWLRLRSGRRSIWRLRAWIGGVVALLVSTTPSVERLADESFTGHMVQHLLMIVVAAPLLVIAAPVRTIRDGLFAQQRPTPAERRVARWWRSAGPVVAPAVFVAVLFVTHLTGIYDRALQNRFVHDLEHIAYIAAAVLLWAVVRSAGRASAAGRVGTAFAVIAGSALLGVVLLTASEPLMATYAASLGRQRALSDQRGAAALMWVGGMALTLPLLITAVWRWAASEQRDAERVEHLAILQHAATIRNRTARDLGDP